MDKRLLEELESVNTQDEFLDIILKICLKEYMEATKPLLYLFGFCSLGFVPLAGHRAMAGGDWVTPLLCAVCSFAWYLVSSVIILACILV